MFKNIILNIGFFLAGSIIMFSLIKTFDKYLWFRPSFLVNSMQLTAQGGPFKIYSSPRTGPHDFVVFRGNAILVNSESISGSSNDYVIQHCENGSSIIESHIQNGQLVRRIYNWDDVDGRMKYIYYDTNADGIWDMYADVQNKKAYGWQNDKWVLFSKKPKTLGTNVNLSGQNLSDGGSRGVR